MRALIAALLMVSSAPAFGEECRFFSPDGVTSLTSNEEDMLVTIHRPAGDQVCDLETSPIANEFVIRCDGDWTRRLAFLDEIGVGVEFGDEFWRYRCFEQV